MYSLSIKPPYPAFSGADGLPLENGYIWVGVVNLSPQVNPVSAFWDAALTIPAGLPIRTLKGYPVYQGTPSRFYVSSDYSIQVLDSKGSVVYTSLNGNAFPGSNGNLYTNATGTGTQTVFPLNSVPILIYINGVYQNRNTYSSDGVEVTFSQAPPFSSVIEFLI
jgi:hypothetical protein